DNSLAGPDEHVTFGDAPPKEVLVLTRHKLWPERWLSRVKNGPPEQHISRPSLGSINHEPSRIVGPLIESPSRDPSRRFFVKARLDRAQYTVHSALPACF